MKVYRLWLILISKGNHATITNLQGPLSMMFNVQIHKDLKLKGQQVKTFYVDKKI